MRGLVALRKFRWFALAASLVICLAAFVVLMRPEDPAPFLVLHPPFSRPLLFRDRIGSLLPSSPWVWRGLDALFGKRTPVNFSTSLFSLSDPDISLVSPLALGSPTFAHSTGLQVWLLGTAEIQSVRQSLRRAPGITSLSSARISTADGVEAALFTGSPIVLSGLTKNVGLAVDCFARVRDQSTDLFLTTMLSEAVTNQSAVAAGLSTTNSISIQTNLDIAVRLQIPKGKGLLLIKPSPDGSNSKTFGAILDPP